MIELILCSLIINKCVVFSVYPTMDLCADRARLLIEDIPVSAFCSKPEEAPMEITNG